MHTVIQDSTVPDIEVLKVSISSVFNWTVLKIVAAKKSKAQGIFSHKEATSKGMCDDYSFVRSSESVSL